MSDMPIVERLRAPAGEIENAMLCVEAADLIEALCEALAGAVHFSDAVAYRDDTLSRALREWLNAGAIVLEKARGQSPIQGGGM